MFAKKLKSEKECTTRHRHIQNILGIFFRVKRHDRINKQMARYDLLAPTSLYHGQILSSSLTGRRQNIFPKTTLYTCQNDFGQSWVQLLETAHVLLTLLKRLASSLAFLTQKSFLVSGNLQTFCHFSKGLLIPDFLQKSYFSVL